MMATVFATIFRRPALLKAKAPPAKKEDPIDKLLAGLPQGEHGRSKLGPYPVEQPPEGAAELGKTKKGKPVHVSGAGAEEYDDEEHHEAARHHMRAHAYHEERARHHTEEGSKAKDDWQLADAHDQDSMRHARLADHHFEVAGHHLRAGGKGSSMKLHYVGGRLVLGPAEPDGDKERKESRDYFQKRKHTDHPGGITDADRGAYKEGSEFLKAEQGALFGGKFDPAKHPRKGRGVPKEGGRFTKKIAPIDFSSGGGGGGRGGFPANLQAKQWVGVIRNPTTGVRFVVMTTGDPKYYLFTVVAPDGSMGTVQFPVLKQDLKDEYRRALAHGYGNAGLEDETRRPDSPGSRGGGNGEPVHYVDPEFDTGMPELTPVCQTAGEFKKFPRRLVATDEAKVTCPECKQVLAELDGQ